MNPVRQFFEITFKDLSVNHAEEQTCLLIVYGIVIDITPVGNQAHTAAVEDGILHPLMLQNLRSNGRLARTVWPGNDNEDWFVKSGYHVAGIFWASCRICSKKRFVASSLVRLASSAASFISCERTASEGSSMLVNRYVSIVGFITMMFTISGAKVQNKFHTPFKTK